MTLPPFSLQVPVEPRLRALVTSVAGRYFELCGGSPEKAAAFGLDVQGAVDALGAPAAPADVSFQSDAVGVDAEVSCGGTTTRVRSLL